MAQRRIGRLGIRLKFKDIGYYVCTITIPLQEEGRYAHYKCDDIRPTPEQERTIAADSSEAYDSAANAVVAFAISEKGEHSARIEELANEALHPDGSTGWKVERG
jgi:hypothetical protein